MISSMNEISTLDNALLRASKQENKGVTFIKSDQVEKFVTYKEIWKRARQLLSALRMRGLEEGNELIFQIEDTEAFVYTFWACIIGRIIAVPITVENNNEHKFKMLNICKYLEHPFLATDDPDKIQRLKEFDVELKYEKIISAIADRTVYIRDIMEGNIENSFVDNQTNVQSNDIAFIQFSSGSTGDPKGVILSHKNLLTNIRAIISCAQITNKDSLYSWMPLTHDMGIIGGHMVGLVQGINHYLMSPALFISRPLLWLEKVSEHHATLLLCPNFGYKYFLKYFKKNRDKSFDLSSVRLIFNGAEPISISLCNEFLKEMKQFGLHSKAIFPVYGMAEACLAITFPHCEDGCIPVEINRSENIIGQVVQKNQINKNDCITFVDVGYPVDHCSVRICDEENKVLEENIVGLIQIKGDNVTRGYYNNKEMTEKTFTEDGWLNTGDVGFLREGRLVITARLKEILFSNGKNYYPNDIEMVINKKLGFAIEMYACGIYDEALNEEVVCIFVLFRKKVEEFIDISIKVRNLILSELGLQVKYVIPVRKIPRTTSRKVQRYKLVQDYNEGVYNEVISKLKGLESQHYSLQNSQERKTTTENKLIRICKDILDREEINVNDNFIDLGGSSILITQFYNQIDAIYPNKIEIADIYTYSTIAKLAEFIDREDRSLLCAIPFPDEYMNHDVIGNKNEAMEASFDFDLSRKIARFCRQFNYETEDILLGIYAFLIHQIASNESITIPIMTEKNRIVNMCIDFSKIMDTTQLLDRILKSKRSLSESYTSTDLLNSIKSAGENEINTIFIFDGCENKNYELLNAMDLVVEMRNCSSRVSLLINYTTRISKDKLQEFFHLYIRTLEKLVS